MILTTLGILASNVLKMLLIFIIKRVCCTLYVYLKRYELRYLINNVALFTTCRFPDFVPQ